MAKLKIIRCVLGLLFLLYLKLLLSNISTVDVEIVSRFALPAYLRFVPPVILSVLILLTMYYWIRKPTRSTIAMFLTVEFMVILFSYALLPTDDACGSTIMDWQDSFNCITVNLSAQLIVFSSIISRISHSRLVKGCTYFLLLVAIIVLLLYERTADIIISVVFTVLTFSNPFVIKISKLIFITESPYFERIHDVTISKHMVSKHMVPII
jgi:hypothetical protein